MPRLACKHEQEFRFVSASLIKGSVPVHFQSNTIAYRGLSWTNEYVRTREGGSQMLRATLIALAAATLLGAAPASAAPIHGHGIAAAVKVNAPIEHVWWWGRRHHRHHWYHRRHWRRW
jgi:hypothetical protein